MNFLLASHRLGRICGFEVRLAYSLYMVAALFFFQYLPLSPAYALAILGLPFFVLAHELGHSLAARFFGVPVVNITLHALGGAAQLGGRIPGAFAELVIAAAGPCVTFVCAGIFFALAYGGAALGLQSSAVLTIFYVCAWQNLILGLFNLLPVFPLDGGRVALALAAIWRGIDFALRLVRPLSCAGALLFVVWGLYDLVQGNSGGVFTLLIGVMLFFQGGQEMQARQYAAQYAYPSWNDWHVNANGILFSIFDRLWNARRRAGRAPDNNQFSTRYSSVDFYGDSSRDATAPKKGFFRRWLDKRAEKRRTAEKNERDELNRRVDEVLDKVKREGISNLTPGEKALLQHASETYRKD